MSWAKVPLRRRQAHGHSLQAAQARQCARLAANTAAHRSADVGVFLLHLAQDPFLLSQAVLMRMDPGPLT